MAGARFVIVPARLVRDSRRTPIIHAHLPQGPGRNPDPGSDGAAFEVAQRQRGTRRRAPEMPNPIGALSHAQHRSVVCRIISQRHGIVLVGGKPWRAHIKPTAYLAAVLIKDNFSAVNLAR